MPAIRNYQLATGQVPFERWFDRLNQEAARRVTIALRRLESGNVSAVKTVGKGVQELRIDFGPGYRIYLGLDGDELVILLGGSTKARQDEAIAEAQGLWQEYRQRKRRQK